MKWEIILAVMLIAPIFAVIAAEPENGETLYKARCGICHQLPDPNLLKPEQWPRLLDTKQKLMEKAGMQPLTTEEYKRLLEYVLQSIKK